MTSLRAAFVESRGFPLDDFQVRALDALDAGRSVLVAAPTGSGKTVVAEYAVEKALGEGRKVFYTTPLKALSNQKYTDLVRAHGAGRVGLLTGDNSVNGEAPVVVMTTEVLRNMIYAASPTLEGLRYVVLDEVHYLQNPYRGAVWEEVIIHLAPEVDLVCLSATVSNAEEFADWIETVRGETQAIIEERRPVRLRHLYLVGDREAEQVHILPTFVEAEGPDGLLELRPNPEASRLDSRSSRRGGPAVRGRPRGRLFTPRRIETVERLDDERMLPAIYFIFSRAGCDQAVDACLAAGMRLTDPEERGQIRQIAERRLETLSDADLELLGYSNWMAGLEAGFAAHHAGMVPPMKEAVEEAFAGGLVKVVFATETLSLGINMPARTVVIEKLSKFTGERHEFLTPGEYTQLTGRAGRRGIDDLGYAAVLWNPYVPFDQVASLASTRSYALQSSFRPTYNMAANLVRRYPPEVAHHLLNLSFAQYGADKEIVRLERHLERSQELLASHRQAAQCERGDVEEYRTLLRNRAERRQAARGGSGGAAGFDALKPGDVIARRGGKAVVLQRTRGRGDETKLLVLTADRGVVRLGPTDFAGPVRAIAAIELPRPFAPRSPAFRRAVAEALKGVRVRSDGAGNGRRRSNGDNSAGFPGDAPGPPGDPARQHPVAGCPDLGMHLRYAERAERLARDVDRLERRIRGRTESLARQFDRVLRVLDSWGYVEGWELSEAGEMLTRLYSETDLLLAESLREGLLDGLDTPSMAAVCSVFSYETRGPDQGAPQRARFPNRTVRDRVAEIERISRDLSVVEDEAGLPETRPPDPGFAAVAHAWAAGKDLEDVLLDEELTGGDFVRNVKQLIDLLRQIGDVAARPETASSARSAADALFRGVVAASSTVGSAGAVPTR
ncbi:MAG TPA: DEAD/DEAH box helicase [Acidimicrobiia bacterium]|nr:DEAD/DEAH box helicase [Acidimicrobiia bacterium]